MLQVGLKLRKFLAWRDVTLYEESLHIYDTERSEKRGRSLVLETSLVKRETSIFEIIKNDTISVSRADYVKNRLRENKYRNFSVRMQTNDDEYISGNVVTNLYFSS